MRKLLASRAVKHSLAILMSIAMFMSLMPTSMYAYAEDTTLSNAVATELATQTTATGSALQITNIALEATATASGEHPEWGCAATNLNNGHVPTTSSNPVGSWHDYGLNPTDKTTWVQYDWTKDVTVSSMSIYWMCDGIWGDRIPKSITVEYQDANGNWLTAANYDATVMAAQLPDQYNDLSFGTDITTKAIRMTMERNTDEFVSIHSWQVLGNFTPVDVSLLATATASGEHPEWGCAATNLNNGHVPTTSSDPAGSWHDYGLNPTDTTTWVQYDWVNDVSVNKMSVYWMNDGVWTDRIPKSIKVEYLDSMGNWQTAANYDASVMAAQLPDQYNTLMLDSEVTTKSIRMTMERNTDNFVSIHRWQVWGQASDAAPPELPDTPVVTKTANGYKMVNKYFIVETGKYGQITNLQLQNDKFPTNYVMNAKNSPSQDTSSHEWLGELMFSVKVGDATVYTEQDTSRSDSGRTVELKDNKVIVTYQNATEEKGIKDFKVEEIYSIEGNKLHWETTVTNTNENNLTIGDFGVPVAFNQNWPGGEEIYETRTLNHMFVGKQSSYLYVTRPSGLGKFLLMTPDASTGAGFEYCDQWHVEERPSDEKLWCSDQGGWADGLSVLYIHSDDIKRTNRGYLGSTSLTLAPGESKTYSFNFSAVDDEATMKSTLYKEGIIDAVAVPGMAYSINMPGKFYLHTSLSKDDISFEIKCPHDLNLFANQSKSVNNMLECKKTNENTYVKYNSTVNLNGEQYLVYDVHFGDLGQNNVVVKYNGGKSETDLQFYMMDDVTSALSTHSDFMVDKTQYNDPLDVSDKVFDDWMMDTKNKRGETDPKYWQKSYWGWGDDWALTHGEFIAEKNVYQPSAKEIKAVDDYLDIAIWNGLMREHQKDYLIHDFYMESPNASPTYRGYAYPHIYNTFYSMYKIESKYPDMIEYAEDADTYLLRAYNILKALYGSGVSYNWSTGIMGELTTPDIIAALEKEGYYKEAQNIKDIMAKKYSNFKDTKYPYGSEYSYDNTGEEAVYTLAKMNLNSDTANANSMMSKINAKTRACRGLQPVWYYYADPTTICGDSWWQFQYTASLAGYCMDDWLRLQNNGMSDSELATAARENYAAKLANLTSINSGQIDADPANVGAIAWTYQSELGNMGGFGTGEGNLHNGWRQMSGEADLGLFGALQILSSDVTVDPVFGLLGYGCNVTENSGIYTVDPLDGLFTRLNFINQKLYIELDRDQYTQAKVSKASNSVELSMKNLEGTAHKTDVEFTGLAAGTYQVAVNGTVTGSFQAVDGQTSVVTLSLPAAATADVTITAGTALDNRAPVVTLDESKTVAISDEVTLEANATDDGYVNSTLSYNWEVVSTPEGGTATFATNTKHITNVTFSSVGTYVIKVTVNDGELSTSKEITVTVTENPVLPKVVANFTFEPDTIVGTNKLAATSTVGKLKADVDDNTVFVDGKDGKGAQYTGKIANGYIELPGELTKNLMKATITTDVKLTENQANYTTLFEFGKNVVVEFVNGNVLSMTVNGKTESTGIEFAPGYWKNIELTVDGDDYTLYINGVKKASLIDTGLSLAAINTKTERYLIGRSNNETDPFLKGIVDNFEVRSFIMTEEQLSGAYASVNHDIISAKASSVITLAGAAPILPTQVNALYSDGVYEKCNVVWNAVDPSSYSNAGTFVVNGKLKDTNIAVTCNVIVVKGTLQNVASEATSSAIFNNPNDLGGVIGLNDGFDPTKSSDTSHGVWHNWGGNITTPAWIQYDWVEPQVVSSMDIYFFKDNSGNFAPASYTIEYLNEDGSWCSVTNPSGLGVDLNKYNKTTFDPVMAKGLRVTINPAAQGVGVIEWKVYGYKDGAVIDKSALNVAISNASSLKSDLFTSGMDKVTTELEAAKIVAANKSATQNEIDIVTVALNDAILSLTPVIPNNMAYCASVSASFTSSWEHLTAVKDGAVSSVSNSSECQHWGTWGNTSASESVTYSWGSSIDITSCDLYIWTDGGGIAIPTSYLYEYMDGEGKWVPVPNASGYQKNMDGFNSTTFDKIRTSAIRVTLVKPKEDENGVGLVEWRVFGTKVETPVPTSAPVPTSTPLPTSTPGTPNTPATPAPTSTPKPTVTPTKTPDQKPVVIPGGTNQAEVSLSVEMNEDQMNVAVAIDQKDLKEQLSDAVKSGKQIEIPIINNELVSQAVNNGIDTLDISLELPTDILTNENLNYVNINLPKDLLQQAKDNEIGIKATAKDETGKELYSWTFNKEELARSDRNCTDVNLTLSVSKVQDIAPVKEILSTQGVVLNFNHEGVLPVQASVKIYVGNIVNDLNSPVYLYHYNPEINKLETLPFSSNYIVDSEGYITINLVHCSDYVALSEPASKKVVTSLSDQINISASTKNLYIGGTKGSSYQLEVIVPATLEIVKSLGDKTSSSAIGGVTVSYSSSNKKIATVDKNGKITAKGTGIVNIKTTIKLYNNKTKVFTTKITVKKASFSFKNSTSTMKVGQAYQFTVAVKGFDLKDITWTTTKKSIITIDKNGKAIAKSKGTVHIVVKVGNQSKKINVVVK